MATCPPIHLHQLLVDRGTTTAFRWYTAIAPTSFTSLPATAVRQRLHELTIQLIPIMLEETQPLDGAEQIGAALVDMHYVQPATLQKTLDVLSQELLAPLPQPHIVALQPRLIDVLSAIATGFCAAMARRILDEQEEIRRALLTERQQAEAQLRRNEASLRAIFEGAALGIAVVDTLGQLIDANPAFQSILGYTAAELQQQGLALLAHPDDMADDQLLFAELIAGQRGTYEVEKRLVRKTGEVRWAHLIASLISVSDGRPPYVLTVIEDITERKRTEAGLLHLHKLDSLGVLAGGIAHEFNNILIVIMGNVELARLDQEPAAMLRHITQIELAAQRAADLTNQMLTYAGHVSVEATRVDLTALVLQIRDLLAVAVPKGVELSYLLAPDMPTVIADAMQLRQALVSLVINAAEALEQQPGTIIVASGTLTVDAAYHDTAQATYDLVAGEYVYVEVSDPGCGMSPATRTNMFDPFFTTKASGSGLSLASVRGVVRSHGGAIQVWTEVGLGSRVRILLPV